MIDPAGTSATHLIVHGQHDRNAAGFEPFDRCRQQVAGRALHHVLDEGAEPAAIIRPLAAGIVLEHHVGRRALKLALDQPRLRVGDLAAGGQGQIEIAVLETGDNLTGCKRLSGADGDPNCPRELAPVFDRPGMGVAPGTDVGEDLLVRALVVRDDAPPRANRAAEAAGEIAGFALVALLLRETGGIVLAGASSQRRPDRALSLCRSYDRIRGRSPVSMSSPLSQARILDSMAPKSAAISTLPGAAQTVARAISASTVSGLPYWRSCVAILRPHGIDRRERDVALVLLQVLQLRAAPAPATRSGAVHSQRAAHAIIGIAGVGENALVLPYGRAGPVAAQFEYRAGGFIRFSGEHRADGATAHAGHGVAVLDGIGENLTDLIDRRDLAFGVFLQGDVDGVALMHRHVARRGGQLAIGANATTVDDGVEDLDASFALDQRLDLGMLPDRARGADVLRAIFDQSSELLCVEDPMQS